MLRKLYVVRHGETLWNKEFRLQGRLDSALTDTGKRQADENGRLLRRAGVTRLLVSPLGRTTETAYIINSYLQAKLEFVDELVERDSGEWSGLTLDDIRASDPMAWREREANEWDHRPPGGENLPDVIARVAPVLEELRQPPGASGPSASTTDSPVTAIISHGVVGKAILAHYLGLSAGEAAHVRQPNDVVYALSFAGSASDPLTHRQVDAEYYRRGEGPLDGIVRSARLNPGGQSGQ